MRTNSKQRLFEVMGKVDETFKPRLFESRDYLLDYFKTMWSTSEEVKRLINSSGYLLKKYGQYIDPAFDWDALSDEQLKWVWDEWSVDEHILHNPPRLGMD